MTVLTFLGPRQSVRPIASRFVHTQHVFPRFIMLALALASSVGCYASHDRRRPVDSGTPRIDSAFDGGLDALERDTSTPECTPGREGRVQVESDCEDGSHVLLSVIRPEGGELAMRFDDCSATIVIDSGDAMGSIEFSFRYLPLRVNTLSSGREVFAITQSLERCAGCDTPAVPLLYVDEQAEVDGALAFSERFGWRFESSCAIDRDGCEHRDVRIETPFASLFEGSTDFVLERDRDLLISGRAWVLSNTARCAGHVGVVLAFRPRVFGDVPCSSLSRAECMAEPTCAVSGANSIAPLCRFPPSAVPWGRCTQQPNVACDPCPAGSACVTMLEAYSAIDRDPCESCDLACCDDVCSGITRFRYCEMR